MAQGESAVNSLERGYVVQSRDFFPIECSHLNLLARSAFPAVFEISIRFTLQDYAQLKPLTRETLSKDI